MYAVYVQTRSNKRIPWIDDEDGDTMPIDVFNTLKEARYCKKLLPHTEVSRPIIMRESV